MTANAAVAATKARDMTITDLYQTTRRVIVVVGMHYAGGSAIAQGLKSFGMEVLDADAPLFQPDHARGWWERHSIVALSDQVLDALGIDWHSLKPIESSAWNNAAVQALKYQAVHIIRAWMGDFPYWIFQDPRAVRLLPFWQQVFTELDVEASYIIAVRKPASVAQCMLKHHNIAPEKTYLLWLQYILTAFRATHGLPRTVVDYDRLQADPSSQMKRIVENLAIPTGVETFSEELLSFALKHLAHGVTTPYRCHQGVLQPAQQTYELLDRIGAGEIAEEDEALQAALARYENNLLEFAPVFHLLDTLTTTAKTAPLEQGFLGQELNRQAKIITALEAALAQSRLCETEMNKQFQNRLQDQQKHIDRLHGVVRSIEESEVWRLTYPLRWGGTRLKELARALRRRRGELELVPGHNLEPVDASAKVWKTVGHDPHFLLNPKQTPYPSGWTRVQFKLGCSVKAFVSCCLYIDGGEGFSENTKVDLPVLKASAVDRVIHLPAQVHALRLDIDSADHAVEFTLSPPRFSEIGKFEAHARMLAPFLKGILRRRNMWAFLLERSLFHLRTSGWQGLKNRLIALYGTGRQPDAYSAWVASFDTLSNQDRRAIKTHISELPKTPLISVIMPVYDTPEKYLRRAIDSVRNQLYPYWELCIADDASSKPHVKKVLDEYRARDPRIKVIFRKTNGHISLASNTALKIAQGEFVALLDHDDELAEHALYMVAAEINAHPDADIMYSDEDKIDKTGIRFNPHFKSDWNPDLFYAQNYVCHLGVYRRSLVQKVGGFRQGYEGSQDYDLCLRCAHATVAARIRHIPQVLYHWRVIEGSTALDVGEKSYAERAALNMLNEHFQAIDPKIRVEIGNFPTTYRIRYPLPSKPPLVSLIIPTRDGYAILKQCIDSMLAKTTYSNYEIIIVDNQSRDAQTLAYFEELAEHLNIRILRYNHPFNFSRINNYAVRHAKGSVIGLINNDIEVISPHWLEEMVSHALRPEIGAVGAKLLYGDGRMQHGGIITGIGGIAGHSHKGLLPHDRGYFGKAGLVQNISAVTAACLIIRKELYDQLGGLEENNLTVGFNDVDFCLRIAAAGYRNLWTPYAELYHHESLTRGYEDTPEKVARFEREADFMRKRWGERLLHDPYYSPNLTLAYEDFSYANPPRILAPWLHLEKLSTNGETFEEQQQLAKASQAN